MVQEVNVRSKIRSWSLWTTPLCFCYPRKRVRGTSPAGNYLWSGKSDYTRVWHKPGHKTQRLSSLSQTLPCQPEPWTAAWEEDPAHLSVVSFPAWDTGNHKITKPKEKFKQMTWNALWKFKHTLLGQLILSQLWAPFPLVTPTHELTISPTQQLLAQQRSSHTAAPQRQHLHLLLYQALVSLGGVQRTHTINPTNAGACMGDCRSYK